MEVRTMKAAKAQATTVFALGVLAAAALASAGVAQTGPTRSTVFPTRKCGHERDDLNRRWTVSVNQVPCKVGKGFVVQLGDVKVPPKRAPYKITIYGKYGLTCVGGPKPGHLPRSIICGTKRSATKGVIAFVD
jgi:hypothetical protein